jgi:hypothetical protein
MDTNYDPPDDIIHVLARLIPFKPSTIKLPESFAASSL